MTRIEIPIPQPEQNLAFEFVEGKNGLLEFHAESTEAHVAAFRAVNDGIDEHYWSQAAVAASLSKKYGKGKYADDQMRDFGEAVERSVSYLRQIARTYGTFTVSQNVSRDKDLSFNHHRIACCYAKPDVALAHAKANGLSCRALEEWVSEQNKKKAKRATRKAIEAVRTSFLDHLEHVEAVIQDDFIKFCPSKDFARRVYEKGWLSEIKSELRNYNRKLNEDIVRAAIDDEGAATMAEIREVTGLPLSDIEALVGQFIAQGEYEMVPQGGQTDMSRGGPRMVLHKVGTPFGNCSLPQAESRYSN